jgi:hypothetical protein
MAGQCAFQTADVAWIDVQMEHHEALNRAAYLQAQCSK